MILHYQHKAAFADYEDSLRLLEEAFRKAGAPIEFYVFVAPLSNRMVDIRYKTDKSGAHKLVCIEGDSPAQAVKDVAAAVKL